MEVSKRGRTYERGKSISIDLRRSIIDEIVLARGDTITGTFLGSYEQIAAKFRVARSTVTKIWRRYCDEFVETALPKAGGMQGKLNEKDLALIEALKARRGSITMREICDELDASGDVEESVSFSTISRNLQKLPSGKVYTRKKITHIARERLTRVNMIYTQLFLSDVNSKDPYALKFFDEAGIKTCDVGTRQYGHAPIGERCIEVVRKCQSPNFTLNALTSLYDGVAYFNVLDKPTNTTQFLNFFDEFCVNTSPATDRPLLECRDRVIMDNLSCHHYKGGEVLEDFLAEMGIELLYTPIYSPDLNPAKNVFSKVKNALNYDLLPLVDYDMKIAINEAIDTVTSLDMHGFYKNTSYIFV